MSDEEIRLTPTSYIVLGLLELCGEATPYDLKAMVAASLNNFWSVQHAQLYTETARLAKAGFLNETREEGGRRRKLYSLTPAGRKAFEEWRGESTRELYELRDLGLLKLFFGAEPRLIAPDQLAAHESRLAAYEGMRVAASDASDEYSGMKLALESGIGHEREYVRFWKRLLAGR